MMAIISSLLLLPFASDFEGLAILPSLYTHLHQVNALHLPQNMQIFIANIAFQAFMHFTASE